MTACGRWQHHDWLERVVEDLCGVCTIRLDLHLLHEPTSSYVVAQNAIKRSVSASVKKIFFAHTIAALFLAALGPVTYTPISL